MKPREPRKSSQHDMFGKRARRQLRKLKTFLGRIPEIEDLTGATLKRILADAGYNFHLVLKWIRLLFVWFKVWRSGIDHPRSIQIAA